MSIAQVVAVLGLIGSVGGGVYFLEDRFSKKDEVAQVGWRSLERDYENNVELIKLEIKYLEDKHQQGTMTNSERSLLNYLRRRLEMIEKQLEDVKKK